MRRDRKDGRACS